jgi:hypothetical protein
LIARGKVQSAPIDRYFAVAKAQKPAEIDDGRTRLAVLVDNDIDDAPETLAVPAVYWPSHYPGCLVDRQSLNLCG